MKSVKSRVATMLFLCGLVGIAGAKPSLGTWTLSADASVVKIASKPDRYAFDLISSQSLGIIGSGVSFYPTTPPKFSEITQLSTDYAPLVGGIGGGSPRFALGIDLNGNGQWDNGIDAHAFAYFGPVNNGFIAPPTSDWSNSGNMVAATDRRWDINQFGSTNYYDDYATALALLGNYKVLHVYLVIDSGWMFGEQECLVNNVTVNGSVLVAKKP